LDPSFKIAAIGPLHVQYLFQAVDYPQLAILLLVLPDLRKLTLGRCEYLNNPVRKLTGFAAKKASQGGTYPLSRLEKAPKAFDGPLKLLTESKFFKPGSKASVASGQPNTEARWIETPMKALQRFWSGLLY